MRPDTADFRTLFLSGVAMLDVRAPLEFARGAFPGAVNLPLMDDAERHEVGLCYAQKGQQAAIELGHQLVSGLRKAARIAAWAEFARAHPDGYLYCFRGGLRSQLVQQWLHAAGVDYPRVTGGYKAMRGFLIETTDAAAAEQQWFVLGGLTGSGKTDVLADVPRSTSKAMRGTAARPSGGARWRNRRKSISRTHWPSTYCGILTQAGARWWWRTRAAISAAATCRRR
jgi:tRNA 2-selenouridine synthase